MDGVSSLLSDRFPSVVSPFSISPTGRAEESTPWGAPANGSSGLSFRAGTVTSVSATPVSLYSSRDGFVGAFLSFGSGATGSASTAVCRVIGGVSNSVRGSYMGRTPVTVSSDVSYSIEVIDSVFLWSVG